MSNYLFVGASSLIASSAASILSQKGHKVIGISRTDLGSQFDSTYKVSEYSKQEFPLLTEQIDGLVYFPGTINLKPFHRFSKDEFQADWLINVLGAAESVQHFLPQLKLAKSASIVFFSSVAASTGMPFHASIAMAKGAVESLTKSLAAELAPSIRVNCIAPSLTDTPLGAKFLSSDEKREAAALRNPMKKVGSAEEMAQCIEFLISDASAWITGQVLAVDGGLGSLRGV